MSTQKRLKQIIQYNNMNIKQFSLKTGIPYRTVQNYLLEKTTMGSNAIKKIYTAFGIDLLWLLTGNGSMYREEKKEIEEQQPKWLTDWWQQSDEVHKHWLEIQLKQTKPNTK